LCNFISKYLLILWSNAFDMKTATLTDFRAKMKERLQEIEDDQDILILSGPKKRDYVVLTLELFNSMEETAYLTSTQANNERLLESMAQDRADNVTLRELELGEKASASPKRKPTRLRKFAPAKKNK
jgi:antitoxin YefM